MSNHRIISRRGLPVGMQPATPFQIDEQLLKRRQEEAAGLQAEPLPIFDVPIDMREQRVREYYDPGPGAPSPGTAEGLDYWLRRIALAAEMIASTLVLRRGLFGRTVNVGTTPVRIVRAEYLRGYIFLNPSTSIGLTTTVEVLPSQTVVADGVSSSFGVANYRDGHFFIEVTAIDPATTLSVFEQALDPISGTFFDIQLLGSFVGVTGTQYVNVSSEGIATDSRIRWTVAGGAPSATFSVGLVLKDGLGGASTTSASRTIYIGSGSGLSTVSGFPILEGTSKSFFLAENVELFAVAEIDTLPLRIFEL